MKISQEAITTIRRVIKEMHDGFYPPDGICIACGEEAEGVEPDARRYTCEICGEDTVYGFEEILTRDW